MRTGQHLILYDSNNRKILEGPIIDVAPGSAVYVEYNGVRKFDYAGTAGTALILDGGHMTEYRAKIGVVYNKNQVEMVLNNPEPRADGRNAPRYPVDIKFTVSYIYIGARRMNIPNPVEISIRDISSTGMMFISKPVFNIKTRIGYSLWASGGDQHMSTVAEIVRSENLGNGLVKYGCKFEDMINM